MLIVKGRIALAGNAGTTPDPDTERTAAQLLAAIQGNERNKGAKFKICTEISSEINNTQIDNAKDTDVVQPMYNLI